MTILPSASAHVKSCDRPEGLSSVNVIIFKLQALSDNDWGSRDLFGVVSTGQSRLHLPQLLTIAAL